MPEPLAHILGQVVGAAHVVTDPDVLAGRVQDWTGRWSGGCALAVFPADGGQVGAALAACHRAGVHVVVQGGNTGLVGGAVPEPGDVLLCSDRLTQLDEPDRVAHTVAAGAGVRLAALQRHLAPHGLELAVDLAARDSATLGGMAATNAGGVRALHDGAMRRQVHSVDAYDAAGRQVAVLHPLVKDNTGYDLSSLLVGSEGTLAVITRLLLRVVPVAVERAVAVVGLPDIGAAAEVTARLRVAVADLRAAEVAAAAPLELLARQRGQRPPVPTAWMLLVETACGRGASGVLGTALADALAAAGHPDAPVLAAVDGPGMRSLWQWREGITEAIGRAAGVLGHPVTKLDVTLPADRLAAFVDATQAQATEQQVLLFGHIGDGNLHVNLLGPPDPALEAAVLGWVVEMGGSISAEHGIGRAKREWLRRARTEDELATMRAVKGALDPQHRLGRAWL